MRFLASLTMMTIAVVAVLGSLELKSIQAVSETKEKQSFTIHDQERLNPLSWTSYFSHKSEVDLITPKILQIHLKNIRPEAMPQILKKFQKLKYVRIHKLDVAADRSTQIFDISSVLTTD
jgi:hypothetical protein